jgi:hypothetical protein
LLGLVALLLREQHYYLKLRTCRKQDQQSNELTFQFAHERQYQELKREVRQILWFF